MPNERVTVTIPDHVTTTGELIEYIKTQRPDISDEVVGREVHRHELASLDAPIAIDPRAIYREQVRSGVAPAVALAKTNRLRSGPVAARTGAPRISIRELAKTIARERGIPLLAAQRIAQDLAVRQGGT